VLGGEIVRDLYETPSPGRKTSSIVVGDLIDEETGHGSIGGASKEAQRHFDSTCRKLHRFLSQPPR
jgi:hypothetical protein